ncbi:MAG: DUF523 domain-containing protein [Candidatus Rokuibacteriota bacterium]
MQKIETQKHGVRPRVGISACLLGDRVRYDGGHKRDPVVAGTLGALVEWVPVCPEVEIGLGGPRPPIRLAGSPRVPRLVVAETGEDLTGRMRRFAEDKAADLLRLGLDGYVFKSRSPSCGLIGVPVQGRSGSGRRLGRGLYASTLLDRLPTLPAEEEGRLHDPAIRKRFLERVFAAARGRRRLRRSPRIRSARARRRPRPT